MKRFAIFPFLFAGVFLAGLVTFAAGLTWRTGSLEEALAAAKTAGKLLLVDFFTEVG